VWRPLCLLAMLISIVAAISTNLSKSKNTEARIVSVEATNAELEGLQALIEFDQVALEDAVKLYQQYVARVPFVSETPPTKKKSGRFQRPSPT
jgi:electron transfer flavoprotein alpha/beta subunit